MIGGNRMGFRLVSIAWGMWVVIHFIALAQACDTPVYRYAMYRWLPAPYEVYCFHDGALDDAAQQVRAAITKVGESADAPANLVFLSVDLSKDPELAGVPPDVKEAWLKQTQTQLPSYLISSPVGRQLHIGSLSPSDIDALVHSPARQQVAEALAAGKAGVYVLLSGQDTQANGLADEAIREVVTDVAAGKVSLYALPSSLPSAVDNAPDEKLQDDHGQQGAAKPPELEVGFVTLARDDPKERWLIEMLLSLEGDLRETQEPIAFMVYGRGRALFSCLGKGIHRDNLLQDVEFITGACSCTVKDQNPGVDLLTSHNWEAAAEAIAARFGAEEGSGYDFVGDALFPELIIPADGEFPGSSQPQSDSIAASKVPPPANDPNSDEETSDQADAARADATGEPTDATGASQTDNSTDSSSGQGPKAQQGSNEATTSTVGTRAGFAQSSAPPLPTDPPPTVESGESTSSLGGVFWVGAGLVAALIVLFAATFVVLRPR